MTTLANLPVAAADKGGAQLSHVNRAASSKGEGGASSDSFDEVLGSQSAEQPATDKMADEGRSVDGDGKKLQSDGNALPDESGTGLPDPAQTDQQPPVLVDSPDIAPPASEDLEPTDAGVASSPPVLETSAGDLPGIARLVNEGFPAQSEKALDNVSAALLQRNALGVDKTAENPGRHLGQLSSPERVASQTAAERSLSTGRFAGDNLLAQKALAAGRGEEMFSENLERVIGRDPAATKLPPTQQPQSLGNGFQLLANEESAPAALKVQANLPIRTPVPNNAWGGEVVGRMNLMVKGGIQEASIQLHPAELGRLDIQISTEGNQTKVMFSVQNPAAREALDQAMPRLREMLEQSGLELAQSDVTDHSQSQPNDRGLGNTSSPRGLDGVLEEEEVNALPEVAVKVSSSLVDYYI